MSEIEITREVTGSKGRYVYALDGAEAELTYSIAGPGRIIADHTNVPETFRGQGVALKLANRLIADARAEGVKIVPVCSYIKAQVRRHPDWADVIAD
ncbi:GNAT family N-acetyltransferase [Frigidibacter sp. ROC022]|uniref:GNAT family N-acetyltransferase n=1 Tax=Frigidibacter sp. ROC022 TaxID=2971796 RepID=UPI00215A2157|nr:GNAT family N-acetyltransferase [Frigidibacter sp. ROC022]MCR8723996.1 N-acetyltransferase [Frigidibacter sp. ROC022]